ncbi:hypothetical protein Pmani_016072 [Petrolisthes manimaculis]|uniref:Uncharacterized protein n=1 Tax=Petrolisthes manimaculis TaxID=1843537 RepID=A0AAE1PPP9_9EUCA|nr:hypothetical protein Pmani_016072 [Petrolisthes manimaculis]
MARETGWVFSVRTAGLMSGQLRVKGERMKSDNSKVKVEDKKEGRAWGEKVGRKESGEDGEEEKWGGWGGRKVGRMGRKKSGEDRGW